MSQVRGSVLGSVIGFGVCRLATEALGHKTSTADKNRVSAGCGVVGGIVGYSWSADTSRRQCELYQASQRTQLNAQFEEITIQQPAVPGDKAQKAENSTVSVTTLPGLNYFSPGSAVLTPQGRQYFTTIARQYTFEGQKESLGRSLPSDQQKQASDPQKLAALRKDWDQIRIVLVGHTDDTGAETGNATISEQRARAVAEVFRTAGVSPDRLYYQGAGSSLPVADNRTEEGRARNRRVEVIELPPEADVAQYLALRKPNPELFRPLPQAVHVARAPVPAKTSDSFSDSFDDAPASTSIDFGGVPTPLHVTAVSDALGGPKVDASAWGFIQSAHAADDPIYGLACTRDAPDLNQPLAAKQLSTGQAQQAHKTQDFLPGFNDATWLGSVNGHDVGLNHVTLLRDGNEPATNPDVFVKPGVIATSRVKVYEGQKGLLYRVFVQSSALRCLDIVVPSNGGLETRVGNLYYERDHKIFIAPYTPKRVPTK